ncbi:MAG: hypothetical protein U0Q16_03665 [Bryobacteraceae bacterium]
MLRDVGQASACAGLQSGLPGSAIVRPGPIIGGLSVVAAIIGGFLFWTRGAHVELRGEMKKVRTYGIDNVSSIAVVDFRFQNPSDLPFVVRDVELILEKPDGTSVKGSVIAESDAKQMFDAVKALGQKYNDTLKVRDKIASRAGDDRMVSARFELPESALQGRKQFRVRVEEVDGVVSEIVEAQAK